MRVHAVVMEDRQGLSFVSTGQIRSVYILLMFVPPNEFRQDVRSSGCGFYFRPFFGHLLLMMWGYEANPLPFQNVSYCMQSTVQTVSSETPIG